MATMRLTGRAWRDVRFRSVTSVLPRLKRPRRQHRVLASAIARPTCVQALATSLRGLETQLFPKFPKSPSHRGHLQQPPLRNNYLHESRVLRFYDLVQGVPVGSVYGE